MEGMGKAREARSKEGRRKEGQKIKKYYKLGVYE